MVQNMKIKHIANGFELECNSTMKQAIEICNKNNECVNCPCNKVYDTKFICTASIKHNSFKYLPFEFTIVKK